MNPKIPPQLLAHLQNQGDDASRRKAEESRQQQRIVSAWLNTARFKLRQDWPAYESAVKGVRSVAMHLDSPIVSPENANQPAGVAVRFNLEEHECFLHPGLLYQYWRSDLPNDAGTPPVCPACIDEITVEALQGYMVRRGWGYNFNRGEWDLDEIAITDDVMRQKDRTALYTIALHEGRLVEDVILDLMPPAAPGIPLTLLLTDEEQRQIARTEGNSQHRTSGIKAFKKMRELGFPEEVLRRIAWRHVTLAIVPQSLKKVFEAVRILEGSLCQMSGRKVTTGKWPPPSMSCGLCDGEVALLSDSGICIVAPHLSKEYRARG